jgi:hypothetical protein
VKRFLPLGAALAAVLSIGAGSVLAIPIPGTLDQQQTIVTDQIDDFGSSYTLAQTFTAGQTGTLDAIGIYVGAVQSIISVRPAAVPTPDLYARVRRRARGGVPDESDLYDRPGTTGLGVLHPPGARPDHDGNAVLDHRDGERPLEARLGRRLCDGQLFRRPGADLRHH